MSKKVVLAGACRTAIGTMGGSLSTTPAQKLVPSLLRKRLKELAFRRIRWITYIWVA